MHFEILLPDWGRHVQHLFARFKPIKMKTPRTYIHSVAWIVIYFLASWETPEPQKASFADNLEEVRIGTQVWMSHNLNVVTFRNGDTIPQARTKAEWRRAHSKRQPAWCYYNNDSANGAVHGKLYNWFAVNDSRGLAPAGWHIPSGNEWHTLYDFLGGEQGKVGRKLKSSAGWEGEGNGENAVGFNAMPSGVRDLPLISPNNGYRWQGALTIWWSTNMASKWIDDIECFVIRSADKAVFEWCDPSEGLSVRCVKD